MSIVADARASSIGTTARPKRANPRRSPSERTIAWLIMRPMSSTVWRAPAQVALRVHVKIEAAVPGERVEHVVEKRLRPCACPPSAAVERQRQRDLGLVCLVCDVSGLREPRRSMDSP